MKREEISTPGKKTRSFFLLTGIARECDVLFHLLLPNVYVDTRERERGSESANTTAILRLFPFDDIKEEIKNAVKK